MILVKVGDETVSPLTPHFSEVLATNHPVWLHPAHLTEVNVLPVFILVACESRDVGYSRISGGH